MSDHYLNDQGQVAFIEWTEDGKSARIFKPIAFIGPITVYEEQAPLMNPLAASSPPPNPWEVWS